MWSKGGRMARESNGENIISRDELHFILPVAGLQVRWLELVGRGGVVGLGRQVGLCSLHWW